MIKNKTYIILLSCLAVFGIVMFLVFGVGDIKSGTYSSTIIVGDSTIWSYSNKKWKNIFYKSSIEKLNWDTYKVYSNNKFLGNYLMYYSDKWYVFDKKKNSIDVDGSLLAYNSNYKIDILDFSSENITVDSYVNQVLSDNNISLSSSFTSLSKASVDFDNDGNVEDFYLVSNAFPLDFDPEYIFSIAFMVKNEKIYYLYNDISKNTSFNGCKPYYNSFMDVNNDGVYEIVLSCGKYSASEQVDMLYNYTDNGFKIIISNQ